MGTAAHPGWAKPGRAGPSGSRRRHAGRACGPGGPGAEVVEVGAEEGAGRGGGRSGEGAEAGRRESGAWPEAAAPEQAEAAAGTSALRWRPRPHGRVRGRPTRLLGQPQRELGRHWR